MSLGTVAKVWTFKSSSGSGTYETLKYTDGSTSCGCPGWTRRVAADGSRSCKHIRLVDQGLADSEAVSFKDYETGTVMKDVGAKKKATKVATKSPLDKELDELDKNWDAKRKIKWK